MVSAVPVLNTTTATAVLSSNHPKKYTHIQNYTGIIFFGYFLPFYCPTYIYIASRVKAEEREKGVKQEFFSIYEKVERWKLPHTRAHKAMHTSISLIYPFLLLCRNKNSNTFSKSMPHGQIQGKYSQCFHALKKCSYTLTTIYTKVWKLVTTIPIHTTKHSPFF